MRIVSPMMLRTHTFLLLASLLATRGHAADPHPSERWRKQIDRFVAQDRQTPFRKGGVVFVGSSSIRLWKLARHFPKLKPLNRGFGGSEVADSLYFAEQLVLKHQPRAIVMYAGDNDLHRRKTAKRVEQDFRRFVAVVHKKLPKTRILFIAIKPSTARWKNVANIREANRRIAKFCAVDRRLRFVDVFAATLDDRGNPRADLLAKDGLHLNEKGYAIWTRMVRAALDRKP